MSGLDHSESLGIATPMKQNTTRPTQESEKPATPTENTILMVNVIPVTPSKRFAQSNPYMFKKSIRKNKDRLMNFSMLVKIISNVINILHTHDKNINTQPW